MLIRKALPFVNPSILNEGLTKDKAFLMPV